MSEYTPNRWLLLKGKDCYKVFGTWSGGYISTDEWKLNSGITEVEVDGEYYLFTGYSGSVYRCHKEMNGVAGGWNYGVLESFTQA